MLLRGQEAQTLGTSLFGSAGIQTPQPQGRMRRENTKSGGWEWLEF